MVVHAYALPPPPAGSHRSVSDIWQKRINPWQHLNIRKIITDRTEMIKSVWTIEYRRDWIVAREKALAAVRVLLPREPQRLSQLEYDGGVMTGIINWRTIYSSDVLMVFSHNSDHFSKISSTYPQFIYICFVLQITYANYTH